MSELNDIKKYKTYNIIGWFHGELITIKHWRLRRGLSARALAFLADIDSLNCGRI